LTEDEMKIWIDMVIELNKEERECVIQKAQGEEQKREVRTLNTNTV
jgi:hypothetical protein